MKNLNKFYSFIFLSFIFCACTSINYQDKTSVISNKLSLSEINDCNTLLESNKIRPLYISENIKTLSSWNHIKEKNNNLALSPSAYDINFKPYIDKPCPNISYFNAVLLKKTSDWHQQHSNGIERVGIQNLKFGDVKNFIIEIRINSKNTKIPSIDTLTEKYSGFANRNIIESYDNGLANIGFNFYEKNKAPLRENDNQSFYILTIDQNKYKDKWVRIKIPFDEFSFYIVNEYVKDNKTRDELKNISINGLILFGETKNAKTLRNYIQDSFVQNHPEENFKEIDISIRYMGLELY